MESTSIEYVIGRVFQINYFLLFIQYYLFNSEILEYLTMVVKFMLYTLKYDKEAIMSNSSGSVWNYGQNIRKTERQKKGKKILDGKWSYRANFRLKEIEHKKEMY